MGRVDTKGPSFRFPSPEMDRQSNFSSVLTQLISSSMPIDRRMALT
jgi:hypothetical protein